ncbi:hypothetical protein [Bradyrhizobium sp. WSM1743]|uniref:hypothetical protein n=1 Tax=Bradyrhizobium sp. WSM1743 TaxID=318996 RepID=UPI000564AB1F|nr:hypothetical protein [Bradyrhizobium sp. WSM1743]
MNLLIATNYVRSNLHGIVIVGSSLSARLSESYFNSSQVENLSIAGGASGTGLEIIRRTAPLPKIVVIESNIRQVGERSPAASILQGPARAGRATTLRAAKAAADAGVSEELQALARAFRSQADVLKSKKRAGKKQR